LLNKNNCNINTKRYSQKKKGVIPLRLKELEELIKKKKAELGQLVLKKARDPGSFSKAEEDELSLLARLLGFSAKQINEWVTKTRSSDADYRDAFEH